MPTNSPEEFSISGRFEERLGILQGLKARLEAIKAKPDYSQLLYSNMHKKIEAAIKNLKDATPDVLAQLEQEIEEMEYPSERG